MITSLLSHYHFEIIKDKVKLYYSNVIFKKEIIGHIIPLLYTDSFFNISHDGDEISLFIPTTFDVSNIKCLYSQSNEFSVIKVNQDCHQINDVGVVREISDFFNTINIPIIYINSFNNNYILIDSEYLPTFEKTLIEH